MGCPAAVQRRKLHRRVHHGRGRLGRSLLRIAQGSSKSPRKLSFQTALEVQSRERRLQRGPRLPPPFYSLRLYVSTTADSSACPSLSLPHRARHVIPASNQRRASSARCARVAGVRRAGALGVSSFLARFQVRGAQLLLKELDAAASLFRGGFPNGLYST